ncbi:DNA cytosine methyltransferase [Mycobacterium aquaticum]|uniref:DNA (cytosine-5-)-methyltransferase n=1 Tax=Mycobacterium aquaticum TaxID=1927124 RepID=A0A1X0B6Y2_9MYCO|nr:DNA cytosine methyltransferase [Mycobacterium aquaticum]ORA38082.1 DNA methyltransferase [Mycobacterium aquaticum]
MLTLTDLFCGAGGSSTGAIAVPGVSVRIASNHWDLAVETHNTNHPDADHLCADISQTDPRRFPRTDILWASPECTNHSVAKGKKKLIQADLFTEEPPLPDEAAERSRATMWDVPRFAEAHGYRSIIVENVVDAIEWAPEWSPDKGCLFRSWLSAMDNMGYDHQIVFLNSMHAQLLGLGAPQSRDRMYVLFWRRGNRRPDVERVTRPEAICPKCGPVRAMQAFKPGGSPKANYRRQYVYRCPNTSCRNATVEPSVRAAEEIIDWSLEGKLLYDRPLKKFVIKATGEEVWLPLAPSTMERVRAGIDRYWSPLLVPVEGRAGKHAQPVSSPSRTMTTRNETGLAFVAELRGGGSDARQVTDPLATVTASGNHHALVTTFYGNGGTVRAASPLPTVSTVEKHALIMRNNTARGDQGQMTTPAAEPIRTVTTTGHQSLLTADQPTVDLRDVRFRMLEPREIIAAMDFPSDYVVLGDRREQVKLAGNAVTPPAARDLVGVVAESLGVVA